MKKSASDGSPYKLIARYLRALEPIVLERPESRELGDALDSLSRYLAKAPRREIEAVLARGSSQLKSRFVEEPILELPLAKLESLIVSGAFSRRQLEAIANARFGVPVGSMRSFPRVEHLVMKLMNLIENERTHDVIDAAAKRSLE